MSSKNTVAELKEMCKAKGLPTSGKKDELIARLAGGAEEAEEDISTEANPEKAAATKKAGTKRKAASKKEVEEEEEDEEEEVKETPAKKSKVAAAAPRTGAPTPSSVPVDSIALQRHPQLNGGHVYIENGNVWDVMLNQTNIAQNNNKYYVIQLIEKGSSYFCYNRWGRVGEPGQDALKSGNLASMKQDFEKKFKDKSANAWAGGAIRTGNFVKKAGKYDLLEMAYGEDDVTPLVAKIEKESNKKVKVRESSLDQPTQQLVKLITENDMFKEQLVSFNIDIKKMPLGKLSEHQLHKGFEILEELQADLKAGKTSSCEPLTSKFYTAIPHDFGRKVPDVMRTLEQVQNKMQMLEVLGDIVTAQSMLKEAEARDVEEIEHPLDTKYKALKNDLKLLDKKSKEFKIIETYFENTKVQGSHLKILDVWALDREGEKKRADKHKEVGNRKLLWHGTKVAVLCAILRDGLRIMPHSGGRVGRGLYFASENAKSAGYVGTAQEGGKNVGLMFLNEVILGKEHHITQDDSSLVKPPAGAHSVIAQGRVEIDESEHAEIEGEWGPIRVPQGKAKNRPKFSGSSFFNSEYLVYDEAQVRMKYLLKIQFS